MSGGLYNLVASDGKEFERGAILLAVLGFKDFTDVGRYRDSWVENHDGMPVIAIYTRNGGGNRPDYAEVIAQLQAHPLYLRDADDTFDSTYATFYFNGPVEHRDSLRRVMVDPVDTDQRWHDAINSLGRRLGSEHG